MFSHRWDCLSENLLPSAAGAKIFHMWLPYSYPLLRSNWLGVDILRDLWIFLYILYACSPRWRLLPYQHHTHQPCLALRSAVSLCFRVTQEQTRVSLMRRTCGALIGVLMFPNGQWWSRSTDLQGHSSVQNPQRFPTYKQEKSKHFPRTSWHSTICLKRIFPALVSSNNHPFICGTHELTTFLALS